MATDVAAAGASAVVAAKALAATAAEPKGPTLFYTIPPALLSYISSNLSIATGPQACNLLILYVA